MQFSYSVGALEKSFCLGLRNKKITDGGDLFLLLGNTTSAFYSSVPIALVVGANKGATTGDGVTTDPTFHTLMTNRHFSRWKKIFIEPVPPIFSVLQSNVAKFADPQAHVVNVAVTGNPGAVEMFCWKLGPDGNVDYNAFDRLGVKAFSWMAGTCSMNKQRLFSHYDFSFLQTASDSLDNLIDHYLVEGENFDAIARNVGVSLKSVKYLQIDAEGYDAFLLSLLPWTQSGFRPALVNFETVLLSYAEKDAVHKLLSQAGYKLAAETHQTALWAFGDC